jgi:low affinity iron permease
MTFLMVFVIQNTQKGDAKAIHLKLDELLRGVRGARTSMVRLEELTDEELSELMREFEQLRARQGDTALRNPVEDYASTPALCAASPRASRRFHRTMPPVTSPPSTTSPRSNSHRSTRCTSARMAPI